MFNSPNLAKLYESDQPVLPYQYHSFDSCVGFENKSPVENLGQVFFRDRIRPSPYKVTFKEKETFSLLCEKSYDLNRTEDQDRIKLFQRTIQLDYQHQWTVDNMPVIFCFVNQKQVKVCSTGFPIGCFVTADGIATDACMIDVSYSSFHFIQDFYLRQNS